MGERAFSTYLSLYLLVLGLSPKAKANNAVKSNQRILALK